MIFRFPKQDDCIKEGLSICLYSFHLSASFLLHQPTIIMDIIVAVCDDSFFIP